MFTKIKTLGEYPRLLRLGLIEASLDNSRQGMRSHISEAFTPRPH